MKGRGLGHLALRLGALFPQRVACPCGIPVWGTVPPCMAHRGGAALSPWWWDSPGPLGFFLRPNAAAWTPCSS